MERFAENFKKLSPNLKVRLCCSAQHLHAEWFASCKLLLAGCAACNTLSPLHYASRSLLVAQARLTVENDDWPSGFAISDLMWLHKATGIPLVFDFHHWKFCPGEESAGPAGTVTRLHIQAHACGQLDRALRTRCSSGQANAGRARLLRCFNLAVAHDTTCSAGRCLAHTADARLASLAVANVCQPICKTLLCCRGSDVGGGPARRADHVAAERA